jgi:hypothetical protein
MSTSPIFMNNIQLLDAITSQENNIDLLRELHRRLLIKGLSTKEAKRLSVAFIRTAQDVNSADSDLINENSLCRFYGKKHCIIREGILDILEKSLAGV